MSSYQEQFLRISPFAFGDILIFFAVISFLCYTLYCGISKVDGDSFGVFCDDEELYTSPFFPDTIQIDHNDFTMTVGVTDSTVDVISSSCPHGVCVHSYPISKSGAEIICAPNRVVVKVLGEKSNEEGSFDADIISR